MKRLLLASTLLTPLMWPEAAVAQGCGPQNPNCIVPDRPLGDSTNAAANTRFVQQNKGGGGGGGSPGGPLNAVQFNNPAGTFAGDNGFLYSAGQITAGALCPANTVGCFTTANISGGWDLSVWNNAFTRIATQFDATNTNQFGLAVSIQTNESSSTTGYEKAAIYTGCLDNDNTTSVSASRDCVGIHAVGLIGASVPNGRVWAANFIAQTQPGGVADGQLAGLEVDIINSASNQPLIFTETQKTGMGVISGGPSNTTVGVMLFAAGGGKFHKGFWMGADSLVPLASDPTATFIGLATSATLATQDNYLFRINPEGTILGNPPSDKLFLSATQTGSGDNGGAATGKNGFGFSYNLIDLTDSRADYGTSPYTYGLTIWLATGGPTERGSKYALNAIAQRIAPSNTAFPMGDVGAINARALSNVGDGGTDTGAGARGTLFGGSIGATAGPGSTNLFMVSGAEFDIGINTGASSHYRMGLSVVGVGELQAASLDAALEIGSAGSAWKTGLLFSNIHGGTIPVTGTLIGTVGGGTVPNGIDLSGYTFTGNAFASPSFSVNGAGQVAAGGSPIVFDGAQSQIQSIAPIGEWSYTALRYTANPNGPALGFGKSRGAVGAFGALQVNDVLGVLYFYGSNATAFYNAATIQVDAAEAYSGTAGGSLMRFFTTPSGTVTETEAMRIQASGGVSIGTLTDPGVGVVFPSGGLRLGGVIATSYSGTGASIGTKGGAWTANNCLKSDANGNIVDAGACGGGLPSIAADNILGNPTASAAVAVAMPLVNCSGGANALNYSTTTHTFTCNTISGGSATSITVGTTAVASGTSGRILFDNAGVLGELATIPAANMPAYTGDVTSAAGSTVNVLVNIPTGTTAAGQIVYTNIAAPASPAAGRIAVYTDSTNNILAAKNSTGVVSNTVVPSTASANQFATGVSVAGVISYAQPAFSNLSGSATAAQMPAYTGDVTSSAGATVNTIANSVVTNAKLANMTANTVHGNATASAAPPTNLAMPSCSGATNALIWTTSTGFGCNTISAGGGTPGGSTTQVQYNNAGAFGGDTALTWASATDVLTIGTTGATTGKLAIAGTTSGTTTLQAVAAATGVLTLPNGTDTLVGKSTTDTLANKTFNTSGAGNVLQIAGQSIVAITGTAGSPNKLASVGSATSISAGQCAQWDVNLNLISVGASCVTAPATPTNSVQFNSGGTAFGGSANLTWDGNALNVGGTGASPGAGAFLIKQNAGASAAGVQFQILAGDGQPGYLLVDTFGVNSPLWYGRRARGTAAAKTPPQAGDQMLSVGGAGWDGSAYTNAASYIQFNAATTWSTTDHSAFIDFITTNVVTPVLGMRLQTSGGLTIGGGGDPGAGGLSVQNTAYINSCTFNSNAIIVCQGLSSFAPQFLLRQTVNDSSSSYIVLAKWRSNGAAAVQVGDYLGSILFSGQDTTGEFSGAQIVSNSTQTWTTTAHGAQLDFSTVPNGTTAAALSTRINASGGVSIGSPWTDPGAGSLQIGALCSITGTNGVIGCASSSSFLPQVQLVNNANDISGPNWNTLKNRAGGAVLNGDALGTFSFQGFSNSAYQNAATFGASVAAAPSGSNVPTQLQFKTSNAAGLLNQSMTFNNAAHLGFGQATAPTLTAGCNGAGGSITTGATDTHGKLTGQTATATTCTVTFGTAFAAAPACTVTSEIQAAGVVSAAPTTSTLVITWATATASMKLNWHCMGA